MRTILASTSPRRKAILTGLVPRLEIVPPDADETVGAGESPALYCARTAREKALSVARAAGPGRSLVIAADTIVTIDGMILGKPADRADAERILSILNGRTHRVVTALCLVHRFPGGGEPPIEGAETTGVTFRKLSAKEMGEYLDSIEYMDKAGSYAFQDRGSAIIERYDGSVTNIIGFPLGLFFSMLSGNGLAKEILA